MRIRRWGVVSLVGLAAFLVYARFDWAQVPGGGGERPTPPGASEVPGSSAPAATPAGASTTPAPLPLPGTHADSSPGPGRETVRSRFARPLHVRGLYANAWAAGSATRMAQLLDIARRTEVNALVIDVKDASGFVSHRTEVALAHEIGATREVRIPDLPALLDRLEREGIYPIARIVIVRDPILAERRPELAVNDTAGGVWRDSKGLTWLDPHARQVWDYHVALAREVALLGFPEIQFDYVRFPDAPPEDLARAVFPSADGRSKVATIRALLSYVRESLADLEVSLAADVFGVTASADRDVGIGQVWESFVDRVDVALPMVYPSHYWRGSFGFQDPNAHPYEIVRRAVSDALRRSARVEGAGRTIPWLQDFTLGPPPYTAAEVRAQIQAAYDAGVSEWILWNPGSRYTEAALEPEGGFATEPLIRVANRLVFVSERHAVLDSIAAARTAASAAGASGATPANSASATPARPFRAQAAGAN